SNFATFGPVPSQPERMVSTTSRISASSINGDPKTRNWSRLAFAIAWGVMTISLRSASVELSVIGNTAGTVRTRKQERGSVRPIYFYICCRRHYGAVRDNLRNFRGKCLRLCAAVPSETRSRILLNDCREIRRGSRTRGPAEVELICAGIPVCRWACHAFDVKIQRRNVEACETQTTSYRSAGGLRRGKLVGNCVALALRFTLSCQNVLRIHKIAKRAGWKIFRRACIRNVVVILHGHCRPSCTARHGSDRTAPGPIQGVVEYASVHPAATDGFRLESDGIHFCVPHNVVIDENIPRRTAR